jgi:hypothetical protein
MSINVLQTWFDKLLGAKGTKVQIGAGTITGSFNTIYVGVTATFTAVVGGGVTSSTWVGEIPAGTTLTVEAGKPVTSASISAGTVACY